MRITFLILLQTCATSQASDSDPFTECLVPDLNVACTDRCEINSLDCFAECQNNTVCWSQCLRENTECIKNCPCEVNCLDGCDDCDNPVCSCQVVEENPDWNRCIDENSLTLGRCVHSCENNDECENDCLARFKSRQLNCPCEENCSAGCPCSDFDCVAPTSLPTTTTTTITTTFTTTISSTPNAVLVLNAHDENNKPFIMDFNGNINKDLNFEYGDFAVPWYGCGATFQNVFWYFGGRLPYYPWFRQASKIVGCKLVRQANMPFDFNAGSCNVFNQTDQKVLLCFDLGEEDPENRRKCHTFDGKSYQFAGTSTYSHVNTYGMANYRGQALTTGCSDSLCSVKTEFMDMNTLTWNSGPDYPFTSDHIAYYSTVSTSDAAYIIGGWYTEEIIAEFKNNIWRQMGTLAKGRDSHGSISLNDEFMVIGGNYDDDEGDFGTEIWSFKDENYKVVDPIIPNDEYACGIGLYIVPFDFCTD